MSCFTSSGNSFKSSLDDPMKSNGFGTPRGLLIIYHIWYNSTTHQPENQESFLTRLFVTVELLHQLQRHSEPHIGTGLFLRARDGASDHDAAGDEHEDLDDERSEEHTSELQ